MRANQYSSTDPPGHIIVTIDVLSYSVVLGHEIHTPGWRGIPSHLFLRPPRQLQGSIARVTVTEDHLHRSFGSGTRQNSFAKRVLHTQSHGNCGSDLDPPARR